MKKELTAYLSELKFDRKLWKSVQAKWITNFRLIILLALTIVCVGTVSFLSIPRRLNPEVKIPIVTVVTTLPGANPKDVESLLTIPLEDKLIGVKGLDTITSSSNESVSSIVMQFKSNIDPQKAKSDVDSAVSTVDNLPADARAPAINALDFEDQPIWNFAVTTGKDPASLMRFSQILKKRIEEEPKVDRVTTGGFYDQEISVSIDPIKIKEYNISPILLSQAVKNAIASYPAGNVSTDKSNFAFSINSQISTIEDIRNIRITNGEQIIKLGDIAAVAERSKPEESKDFYATRAKTAHLAVQFYIYKISSANIDSTEQAVRKIVDQTQAEFNNDFQAVTITNVAEDIIKQFADLIGEFRDTIILVFINLLIFLGLRQAIISSLTIPLTFLSAVALIGNLGYSLNFLTLFAFLLALGLLIDDTIVTVTAMTRYHGTKKFTPVQTGLLVWRDFIVPLWSTTITTIWAFVPLIFTSGIIGEFIKPIPVVVTATMLSSTSIAVLITLPLMIIILKPQIPNRVKIFLKIIAMIAILVFGAVLLPKNSLFPVTIACYILLIFITYRIRKSLRAQTNKLLMRLPPVNTVWNKITGIFDHGLINTEKLSYRYMNLIDRILDSKSARRKTLIVIVIFAIVGYLLIPLGFVNNEFFPKTDQDFFYVTVDLPAGTKLGVTQNEALKFLDELRKTEYATGAVAGIGSGNPGSFTITVTLLPKNKRKKESIAIAQEIRDRYKNYQKGALSVLEESGGPPAGADVQIKYSGDDLAVLDNYAEKTVNFLKKQSGIANVSKSVKTGTSKLVFVPDQQKLADSGIGIDTIGLVLRSYASGFTLDTKKFNNEETDIVFRYNTDNISPENIGSIYLNSQNDSYPLSALGKLELQSNPTSITHEGGKRTISVAAGVLPGFSPTSKNRDLAKFADSLKLGEDYVWKTGGANEENEKSIQSIISAMGISFILILVTMVIEFGSFRQSLIALTTIPLAISGVFYLFALTGTPLSFPALIGILALFGIEVTTVIVIVEKINENRHEGLPLKESVVDAAGSRLEPILLTSISSVLGLVPVTLADALWRGLGGAIIAGLLIGGFVKLLYVPVMYYIFYQKNHDR